MKIRSGGEGRPSLLRIIILVVIFAFCIVLFVGRLLSLQIANNEYYLNNATPKNIKTEIIETTRGEIADRNGERLVINSGISNIRLNRSTLPRGGENTVLLDLIRFLDRENVGFDDFLPVEENSPYIFVQPQDSTGKSRLNTFLRSSEKKIEDLYGEGLYTLLYKRYGIEKTIGDMASDEEIRRVIGLRYALEASDFAVTNPYTLVTDADLELQTHLSEISYSLPGVEIAIENSRYYPYGSLACHVLGRTGPIFREEAETYLSMGYALGDTVGKEGAEYAFEKYLRGTDGKKQVEYDGEGEQILSEEITEEPSHGKTVRLTVSLGMQQVAENSLADIIKGINRDNRRNGDKTVANGAVVVQDCTNGAVLAIASYPNYDANEYSSTISDMLNDETRPLYNRATLGIFPPGSTFKIATAAAALTNGVIDANTLIYDSGVYKEYETYQPHCWAFDKYGYPHGWQDVVQAITNSCNYYFFEVGKRLGVESLNDYAMQLGLGQKTGIEISENTGILAGPEYRASQGQTWNPGDLIQSAIGQSDNSFTPLQLASFFSTVVNGGTRYKTHLLHSVTDYYTGNIIYEQQPEVLGTVEISDEHLELLKRGMKSVVEDGTAASVFVNYPHSVGGKTGTAQTGTGSDNAIFAGFAPYDEPKIVVSVIIEHGEQSTAAARVAKSVFDYYFDNLQEFN